MKDFLNSELASQLAGKSSDDLKAALFEGEGDEVTLKENAAEVYRSLVLDKFKGAERDKVRSEVGRAIRERMEELESIANPVFQKFKIEADNIKDGLLRLSEIEPGAPGKTGNPESLTKEELQKLPAFHEALTEKVNTWKDKYSQLESDFNQFKANAERQRVAGAAKDRALSILQSKKAAFGEDAAGRMDFFWSAVGFNNFSLSEDGKLKL